MGHRIGSAVGPAVFRRGVAGSSFALAWAALASACGSGTDGGPSVRASAPEAAGRYVVSVAGCNDCHTEAYMERGSEIPETAWLTGSVVGFRGPWGTTYPSNLRLTVQDMSEDTWLETLRTRTGLPPMPWQSVNAMSDTDRRAVYRYLRALGPAGARAPEPLAPGVEPVGPWIDFDVKGVPTDVASGEDR